MCVQHRVARSGDVAGIHDVWRRSLRAPVDRLHADWTADPDPLGRALVAVDGSGVLAVVCVVPRVLRDLAGDPWPVGGIGAVATRPDVRRHGHARQLLERAVELMADRGYAWSLLFTGVPTVYAPLGWQPLAQPARTGLIAEPQPRAGRYRVCGGSAARLWPELAAIHALYNASRPLSAIREARHWRVGVRTCLDDGRVFIAEADQRIVGYAAAALAADVVELREVAAHPEHLEAIGDLFGAVAGWGRGCGATRVLAQVPRDLSLGGLLTAARDGHPGYAMVRTLHAAQADIESAAGAPSARFWLADAF